MGTRATARTGAPVSTATRGLIESPFISFAEAARLLNLSKTTLYRMANDGTFSKVSNPKRPMLLRSEVMAYIEATSNGLPFTGKRSRGRPRKRPPQRAKQARPNQ